MKLKITKSLTLLSIRRLKVYSKTNSFGHTSKREKKKPICETSKIFGIKITYTLRSQRDFFKWISTEFFFFSFPFQNFHHRTFSFISVYTLKSNFTTTEINFPLRKRLLLLLAYHFITSKCKIFFPVKTNTRVVRKIQTRNFGQYFKIHLQFHVSYRRDLLNKI